MCFITLTLFYVQLKPAQLNRNCDKALHNLPQLSFCKVGMNMRDGPNAGADPS